MEAYKNMKKGGPLRLRQVQGIWLAQLEEHITLDLRAIGSSPALRVESLKIKIFKIKTETGKILSSSYSASRDVTDDSLTPCNPFPTWFQDAVPPS